MRQLSCSPNPHPLPPALGGPWRTRGRRATSAPRPRGHAPWGPRTPPAPRAADPAAASSIDRSLRQSPESRGFQKTGSVEKKRFRHNGTKSSSGPEAPGAAPAPVHRLQPPTQPRPGHQPGSRVHSSRLREGVPRGGRLVNQPPKCWGVGSSIGGCGAGGPGRAPQQDDVSLSLGALQGCVG